MARSKEQQALVDIEAKLNQVDDLLKECRELADTHGVSFTFFPPHNSSLTYYPWVESDGWTQSSADCGDAEPRGWTSSSDFC